MIIMRKSTIKKLVVAIIFVVVLVVSFLLYGNITRNNHSNKVSIVKNIINERYDEVVYLGNNYIYAFNKGNNYEYTVFDLNGNKLYGFENKNLLNIVTVSKKYFITKDDEYHLYNDLYEEINKGNNIYSISDYLIYVDGNIINYNNELIYSDVLNIKDYYNEEYFLIDNYFVDKKGKVLLKGYEIIKEKQNNNEIDYFIVKKDNKYYCFFPLLNKIIGDPFDKYFEYEDNIYVVGSNKLYKIVTGGLRKEVKINTDKVKDYKIDIKNIVAENKVLIIKDKYLGLLDIEKNKFHKIVKSKKIDYKIISKNYINIKVGSDNYIYDLNINKIIYSGKNIEDIIMFNNGYKTIKRNGYYFLYDNEDILVLNSDKQILLLDSEIVFGNINKEITLYDDKDYYDGEYITINKKNYFKFKKGKTNHIVSKDLKDKYTSRGYLEYIDETIISLEDNNLVFYNLKTNERKKYNIKKYKIVNEEINKKEIILSNDRNIIILNKKGEVIKKINTRRLEEIYYNKLEGNIIIIERNLIRNKKGVYIAE